MELIVDPAIARFTRAELVAEMQDRFGDFTGRTFRLWQEKGLIAAPRQEGRWRPGRTGSAEALWSGHDRQMLLALLEKRDEHRRGAGGQLQLSELANLVVWCWAFWDGYVALDQVKRALRCWAGPQIGGPNGSLRSRDTLSRRVRTAIGQLAAPGVSSQAKRALAAEMVDAIWCHDLERLRSLEPDVDAIVDPDRCGRRIGASGASVDAHGEIERLVRCHLAASAVVTDEPRLQNKDWFTARQAIRESWMDYIHTWMALRARSSIPDLFGPPELQLQISSCSSTLVYILGSMVESQLPDSGNQTSSPSPMP